MYGTSFAPVIGLVMAILLVLLPKRLGYDWRPAGRVVGTAGALFFLALFLPVVPWFYTAEPVSMAGSDVTRIFTVAANVCGTLGWLVNLAAAMLIAQSDRE